MMLDWEIGKGQSEKRMESIFKEHRHNTGCARDCGLHWCLPIRILNHNFFGLHPKFKLPQLICACIFVLITLVGPTKVSIMKLKCTELNRMWQHDFMTKQIFFSSVFLSENTGRLAKQAGYLGHNPWHTRYEEVHFHSFCCDTQMIAGTRETRFCKEIILQWLFYLF